MDYIESNESVFNTHSAPYIKKSRKRLAFRNLSGFANIFKGNKYVSDRSQALVSSVMRMRRTVYKNNSHNKSRSEHGPHYTRLCTLRGNV